MSESGSVFNTLTGADWKKSITYGRTSGAVEQAAFAQQIKVGALLALQNKMKAPKQDEMAFLERINSRSWRRSSYRPSVKVFREAQNANKVLAAAEESAATRNEDAARLGLRFISQEAHPPGEAKKPDYVSQKGEIIGSPHGRIENARQAQAELDFSSCAVKPTPSVRCQKI